MIKLKELIIEVREIPVVIGIIDTDKGILSRYVKDVKGIGHVTLGYYYGSRWRYNPETKIVYWSSSNNSDQSKDDMMAVEDHLHKKYGYKVKRHVDLNKSHGKYDIEKAHGLMI